MFNDPPEASFSPGAENSPDSPLPSLLHPCGPQTSLRLQTQQSQHQKLGLEDKPLALVQGDSAFYRPKVAAAERFRRHSIDGTTAIQEQVQGEPRRFHPYRRQYSDPPGFQQPLDLYQSMELPEVLPVMQPQHQEVSHQGSWSPSMGSVLQASQTMGSESQFLEPPEESSCYHSQINNTFISLPPVEQFPLGVYSQTAPSGGPQYNFQCIGPSDSQNSMLHTLYPKPIYSYSILIFMALRNSKTGSLPVSEIYTFMTENFPYFKTAPDGWKNSVRHNLSLNKCFEKVENKTGNASRKGCLWALNPAKVEKMQEELYKWRRKDPLTVRRSMARPEELDRLLGDRPQKWKPAPGQLALPNSNGQTLLTSGASPCFTTLQQELSGHTFRHSHQSPALPHAKQGHSPWLPHGHPPHHRHPDHGTFPSYLSSGQLAVSDISSCMPETHLLYSAALQANNSNAQSMQDLLLEGEPSSDVDNLNPSLTDLQLHGHLWEELKDDSLAPDSLVVIATSPPLSGSCVKEECSVGSEVNPPPTEEDMHITGLYSAALANVDSEAEHIALNPCPPAVRLSPRGSDCPPGISYTGACNQMVQPHPSPTAITITQ